MEFRLKCQAWSNLNRRAQNIKKQPSSNNDEKNNKMRIKPASIESLYCLELAGNVDNTRLACLGSNQIVSIYDQANVRLVDEIAVNKETNALGYFKKSSHMIFSCANQGVVTCVDTREKSGTVAIEFEKGDGDSGGLLTTSRDLLCADVNAADELIGVGTNKTVEDALILIYDLRSPQRALHKLRESHSGDISQIKFHPNFAGKFSSAGLDGLVAFYDLNNQQSSSENQPIKESNNESDSDSEDDDDDEDSDESELDPDMMEQCLNTESCVSKIGYLRSANSPADRLFAITTTNDFFLWDLTTYDSIYEKKSSTKSSTDSNDQLGVVESEDYFFDCFFYSERPIVCQANNNGLIKLFSRDSLVYEQKKPNRNDDNQKDEKEEEEDDDDNDDDNESGSSGAIGFRSHRDVVRGSYWNAADKCLFTAGEDGFVLKWKLIDRSKSRGVERKSQKQRVNNKKKRRGDEMVEAASKKRSKKFLSTKKLNSK